MARSHAVLAASLRAEDAVDPQLEAFAAAAEAHFRRAHDAFFSLGQDFAARRKELALSQRELAAAAGVPAADVSRLESGKGNPTYATLRKLANVLSMDVTVTRRA
jgi:DNA-binding XRE family transcriptional regulator